MDNTQNVETKSANWGELATKEAEALVAATMNGLGVELTDGARKVLTNMARVAFLKGAELAAVSALDVVVAEMRKTVDKAGCNV